MEHSGIHWITMNNFNNVRMLLCWIHSTFINLQVHQEILYQNYQLVYITLSLNLCLLSLLIFMQYRKNISLKLNLQVCTYIYLMCHVSQNILTFILAHGSVSVVGNTAKVDLYSNTKGTFKCSLDEEPFQQCMITL